MAWTNTGASAGLYDGARTYGTIYLQYDSDSTGTARSCRLLWDFTTGTSLNVTLRDITLAGGVIGNADVGTSDAVIWSGTLTGGQSYTFSWYCNWYSYGRMDYSSTSGTVPAWVPPVHLYGSVNGARKEIKHLYGSVNGSRKKIKKLYASVNGARKLIFRDDS